MPHYHLLSSSILYHKYLSSPSYQMSECISSVSVPLTIKTVANLKVLSKDSNFNSNFLNKFFLQQYLIFNTFSRHLALKESFNTNPVENCCHIDENYGIYFFLRWWIMYHGEFMVCHSVQSRGISFWSWEEPSMNQWAWGRQPWEHCPLQRLPFGKRPGRGAALVQFCSERDIAELSSETISEWPEVCSPLLLPQYKGFSWAIH